VGQQAIQRRQLLNAVLGGWNVTSVDVREIVLQPSQMSGRHLHPCAVLGYIAEGVAVFQIEGEAARTLAAGSAFYEPAGTIVTEFGNASDTQGLKFIAFYLLDGPQELITLLESK
jgi:quercetin dioxygenase-like cupin family protein